MKQLQYELLLLVGLGQSGNAGLFQDGILGQSCHRRRNIGGADAIFGTRQVLHLVADNASRALKPVAFARFARLAVLVAPTSTWT